MTRSTSPRSKDSAWTTPRSGSSALHERYVGDLSWAEAGGLIRFSSPERQQAIEDAFEAYNEAWVAAYDEIESFIAAEERRIDDAYGIA